MAYSLLDAVNRGLKRVKVISGVNGELSSLTDSARQTYIDAMVQIINESIHELYSTNEMPLPKESATQNVTLVTDTREYTLSPVPEAIRFPLMDTTNGRYVFEYPGGYEQMRINQPQPDNWKGLPLYACINPTNDMLRFDVAPTSTENGLVYELLYDKRLSLSAATDTFPFSDTVVDSLVPAWAQMWSREQKNSFDNNIYLMSFGRASRYLTQQPMRRKW